MAKAAAKKSGIVSAFDYISNPDKYPVASVCTVFGDEEYLKREVLITIRRNVLGGEDAEFALTSFAGNEAALRDVLDALGTMSLFGSGRQLVVVEEADPFVTQYRAELEDFLTRPAKSGTLVLDVKTWPGNTRLAKAVAADGLTVEGRSYESSKSQERTAVMRQIKAWLIQRAKVAHQARLDGSAIDAMLDLVPPEPGILAQEVDKLALLVGENRVIDSGLVRENVGGWRARAAWDMIDAAAEGHAAEAVKQLGRLIASGEKPHGLLAQMETSLRRFATAVELIDAAETNRQRWTAKDVLIQAGVPNKPFIVSKAESQLRQIGRQRARQITRWLLAADLAVKGYNSADDRARIELERLIVRLAAASKVGPPSRGGPGGRRGDLAAPTA